MTLRYRLHKDLEEERPGRGPVERELVRFQRFSAWQTEDLKACRMEANLRRTKGWIWTDAWRVWQ